MWPDLSSFIEIIAQQYESIFLDALFASICTEISSPIFTFS